MNRITALVANVITKIGELFGRSEKIIINVSCVFGKWGSSSTRAKSIRNIYPELLKHCEQVKMKAQSNLLNKWLEEIHRSQKQAFEGFPWPDSTNLWALVVRNIQSPHSGNRFWKGLEITSVAPSRLFLGHAPWALSHEAWAMSHEPGAFSLQPWAMRHEPSINNRFIESWL